LLSTRPDLHTGSTTNVSHYNYLDWIIVGSICLDTASRKYCLNTQFGGAVFLVPTISVAALTSKTTTFCEKPITTKIVPYMKRTNIMVKDGFVVIWQVLFDNLSSTVVIRNLPKNSSGATTTRGNKDCGEGTAQAVFPTLVT